MLEDESGRIKLVGDRVKAARLVTGVIIGALGAETPNGEFEVVDICYADMAPQATSDDDDGKMDVDGSYLHFTIHDTYLTVAHTEAPMDIASPRTEKPDEWIALISGLDIGPLSSSDAQIQLLVEYLTGEGGGLEDQLLASKVSRLIIAGNSLAPQIISDGPELDKKLVSEIL
jgi:DNA polymerase delta subunit 2